MSGTTIGKYRVVGQLGQGATGIVYRAVDDTLGREVALKILNPALTHPEILERFRVEATVLASLSHPGIATIYDLFRSDTELLMVMELVRGETLEHLSARVGPLPPDRASYLVDQILSALEHAHRLGVVHRDMKPANVMVTALGGIKIMDFGIARTRFAEQLAADGYVVGTPAYMPPEQVLGQEVDGRADLYSVGVVLYRLLTGALPFTAGSSVDMLQQQISQLPTPLRIHRADLPAWCEPIVQRALAKSPDDRFQSAGAFRDALARATGVGTTIDLAREFSIAQDSTPSKPAPASGTVEISRTEAASLAMLAARQQRAKAASILLPFAACVASLAYVPLHYVTAEPIGQPAAAPSALVFATKLLAGDGQERDAQLVLSEGRLTVTTNSEARQTVHSVPYRRVVSISYARSRDPMWSSPKGSAPARRGRGNPLRMLGISVQRHWIALTTNMETRFLVLRFEDAQIRDVLEELEDRTGRTAKVLGKGTGD
jgi:tRNA A-37 threonylcarbamoyl transferase component Bud32